MPVRPHPSNPAVAIEVSRLSKAFRLPVDRPSTLKERVANPMRRFDYRELKVLRDVSFDVNRGEFFGVVGRNGSGKSTLLKLLASIYRADAGRIRVAGLVAPVIELGVGFQPEMTARENVLINGLMMGLTAREARRRFDAVIDFAELEDFVELKLKNYSSGMRARLAFAIVMQTDPDVLLLDEVLAVGDPPFQRRCREAFDEIKREARKTVVLVTHSMGHIERYCDRAMLLEEGRIGSIGNPTEIGQAYAALMPSSARLSMENEEVSPPPRAPARVVSLRLLDYDGRPTDAAPPDEPIRLHATVETFGTLTAPWLQLRIGNGAGVAIFAPPPIDLTSPARRLKAGERIDIAAKVENRLGPGRYLASCAVVDGPPGPDAVLSEQAASWFRVTADGHDQSGLVSLEYGVRMRSVSGPLSRS